MMSMRASSVIVRFTDAVDRFLREVDANDQIDDDRLGCDVVFGRSQTSTSKKPKPSEWQTLKKSLLDKVSTADVKQRVSDRFKLLEHVAREYVMVTSDGLDDERLDKMVHNACIALLQILRHADAPNMSTQDLRDMNNTFDVRATSDARNRRAAQIVQQLRNDIGNIFMRQCLDNVTSMIGHESIRGTGRRRAKSTENKDDSLKDRSRKLPKEDQEEYGTAISVIQPSACTMPVNYAELDHLLIPQGVCGQQDNVTGQLNFRYVADRAKGSVHPDASQETGKRWQCTLIGVIEELSASYEDVDLICEQLFSGLDSQRDSDELQMELLDLLGVDKFELLSKILQNRNDLVAEYRQYTGKTGARQLSDNAVSMLPGKQKPGAPAYGQQITIQSEHEAMLQRALRKDHKRQNRQYQQLVNAFGAETANEFSNIENDRQRELAEQATFDRSNIRYEAAAAQMAFAKQVRKYPFVFDTISPYSASFAGANIVVGGAKFILPESTIRLDKRNSEEITIPASTAKPPEIRPRVKLHEMNEVCQAAFKGNTKELNLIQSTVYDAAMNSQENLLICAPTGAGKTNIAMLTVLRVVNEHMKNGVLQKNDFKIVYVAPMKALATEMTRNFGNKLAPLGVVVKELTGDMQLTKREIQNTQMLIVTPEKWDVVTRKSTGDVGLSQLVRLLIIDEVHLLHDDRGAVIETLVSRTLRQVEMRQTPIRIVGLSATLPNYLDVAHFLRVQPETGLFFFDGRFRPVPLTQTFIGVKLSGYEQQNQFDHECYDKALQFVQKGHQVLIFCHARNACGRIAGTMRDMAKSNGDETAFRANDSAQYALAAKSLQKSRNRQLTDLFPAGFGIHHAGMVRADRLLIEKMFAQGHIKVLVCTSTLAWGVNLPAHGVIIRGTDIYDAKQGAMVDLGILDVQQIFGRAGRPQFDTSGHGIIITAHDKLYRYLSMLTRQAPIESQFVKSIMDNLNAEIVLGTVTNVEEAVEWLSYTYFFVRARLNPMAYGITYNMKQEDPELHQYRHDLICQTAVLLDKYHMIVYDPRTGMLRATDLGRTASHYYVKCDTVQLIVHGEHNIKMKGIMTDANVLDLVCHAKEFSQIKVRDEELEELDTLFGESCRLPVMGGTENVHGKTNILLQSYVSRQYVNGFSLISDLNYVVQNASRIVRCLFEIALRECYAQATATFLNMCRCIDRQCWPDSHPFRQFPGGYIRHDVIEKLESRQLSVERLREMQPNEIGDIIRDNGRRVQEAAWKLPLVALEVTVRPITHSILQINVTVTPNFTWDRVIHGKGNELYWIWIENPNDNYIYHHECFVLNKKQVDNSEEQHLTFTIPITDGRLPTQYLIHCMSDRWLGADLTEPCDFRHIIRPETKSKHTKLLDLQPLPTSVLQDERMQDLYQFKHFNAVQTQIFHCLFHSDRNVLLGAPTGSGKTVAAEMAMFRVFKRSDKAKCVYIAPMKALVRERIKDWKVRLEQRLGKKVIELTGDVTPDARAIAASSVIVTTPEKWDSISRSWQTRKYVKDVQLVVIDEVHLLGEDRGAVLEVIVARMQYLSSRSCRIVALSTAVANAADLADWLGIQSSGLYNFRASVRPVPIEVHLQGFPGKHYCPRMATMNKPAFIAIRQYSPNKPVLIFVSSRRQTRLTAFDLISLVAADSNPHQWLSEKLSGDELNNAIATVRDSTLKFCLAFGIGIHHAGLNEHDRNTVERLFEKADIQILVATATLAWGVNFPAHLVIIKGTEYYDGKQLRYVDMPVTDVLQMMGRAGRPQFDDHGVACVFVQDTKKHFYKKFLYEPFPVESNLEKTLCDHMNAEIVAGTIRTKQDAVDYLTWTYYFRRLVNNPSYYGLLSVDAESINAFLSSKIEMVMQSLIQAGCIAPEEDGFGVRSLPAGQIASFYYLTHKSVQLMQNRLSAVSMLEDVLAMITDLPEYAEIPVRHNEEHINMDLSRHCRIRFAESVMGNASTKTHLLLQAHFGRVTLPSTDYFTDLKSVLDQAIRIIQAVLDVAAERGHLSLCLRTSSLLQCLLQACWHDDSPLITLPHLTQQIVALFSAHSSLPELRHVVEQDPEYLMQTCRGVLEPNQVHDIERTLLGLPRFAAPVVSVLGWWTGGQGVQTKRVQMPKRTPSVKQINWTIVNADQDYTVSVRLTPHPSRHRQPGVSTAITPRFPKHKDEGWIVMIGCAETDTLWAIRRVPYIARTHNVAPACVQNQLNSELS